MGSEDYVLRRKDDIVTLLIFKLGASVNKDYTERHETPVVNTDASKRESRIPSLIFDLATRTAAHCGAKLTKPSAAKIIQPEIDLLSPDFVDVQRRATNIARKTLGFATAGAAILAVILGLAFNAIGSNICHP